MSASLGELVISIAADIAKLEAGMSRAEVIAMRTSQKIDQAMKIASDSIAGVAAGFLSLKAVEAFGENIKDAIEGAAALERLSKETGIAAEQLSKFKEVADQSGTSLQTVVGGISTLQKKMLETAQGTGKAKASFQELHLQVQDYSGGLKDADKFTYEVAKKILALDNETQKAAYAMKLFGSSNVIPFLEDLVRKGDAAALVQNRQAREAEDFMRALRALNSANEEFYNVIAQQVTPVLTALARVWLDVKTGAGSLQETVKEMAATNTLRQWATDAALILGYVIDGFRQMRDGIVLVGQALGVVAVFFVESFKNIGTALGIIVASFSDLGNLLKGLTLIQNGFWSEGAALVKSSVQSMAAGVDQMKTRFSESFSNIGDAGKMFFEGIQTRADDLAKGSWATMIFDALGKVGTGLDNVRKKGKEHADVVGKVVIDAYDGLIQKLVVTGAKLQEELRYMQQHGYATKETEVATTKAALEEAKMAKVLQERATREGTTVEALKAKAIAQALTNDQTRAALELETEYTSMVKSENEAIGSAIEQLKEQAATYGQTEDAVTRYRIAQKEALRDTYLAMDPASQAAKDLQYQIEKLYELAGRQVAFTGMRNFVDAVKEGADWVSKLAVGFLDGVSHGIANAREMLKQFVRDLLAMVAKKWVLQLAAGAVGGSTGDALASQATQLGANTLVGAATNYLGLTSGGAGGVVSSILGNGALTGAGDFVGTGLAGMAGNLALAAGATDAFAATIAAAVPVIGWIVAIGAILYAVFGHKGGGQKGGGSAFGTFDAAGQMQSNLVGSLDRSRFLQDENQMDATMAPILGKIAASFYGTLRRLGGTGGEGFQFGLGYNMDPAGTAPSMVSSLLRDAQGQQLFVNSNRDVGRSQEEVSAEMQLQAQRLVLAALQASELPKEIADILDTVSAETGTAEQIQAVLQAAQEAHDVMEGLKVLDIKGLDLNALRAFQGEGESISQTFNRVAQVWSNFNNSFMTDAQKLQAAQDTITAAFQDLGVAIPASNEEFYNLVHSLDLSTEAGRNMFSVLMQVAPAFQTVTNATAAAIQQFYSLASSLSSSFGQSYARMQFDAAIAAWRAVDPNIGADFDVEGTLRQIIQTGSFSAILPYIQSLGPNALGVFNQLLAAYQAWQQSMQQTPGSPPSMPSFPGIPGGGEGPVGEFNNALEEATNRLREFKESLLTDSQLSPLMPREQLSEAASQFQHLVDLARGGDVDAMNSLPDAARTYLGLARSIFKSSGDYTAIFQMVYGALDQLTGGTGMMPGSGQVDLPTAVTNSGVVVQQSVDRTTQAINDLITLIANGIRVSDPMAEQKLDEIAVSLASRGGVLG